MADFLEDGMSNLDRIEAVMKSPDGYKEVIVEAVKEPDNDRPTLMVSTKATKTTPASAYEHRDEAMRSDYSRHKGADLNINNSNVRDQNTCAGTGSSAAQWLYTVSSPTDTTRQDEYDRLVSKYTAQSIVRGLSLQEVNRIIAGVEAKDIEARISRLKKVIRLSGRRSRSNAYEDASPVVVEKASYIRGSKAAIRGIHADRRGCYDTGMIVVTLATISATSPLPMMTSGRTESMPEKL